MNAKTLWKSLEGIAKHEVHSVNQINSVEVRHQINHSSYAYKKSLGFFDSWVDFGIHICTIKKAEALDGEFLRL
jgi:hypothetical protein